MKIAILGDVIETKNIYAIEKMNFSIDIKSHQVFTYFGFKILFFNKKHKFIYLDGSILFGSNDWIFDKDAKIKEKELFDKVNDLRNRILTVWSDNQSDIPQFEF